MKEIRLRELFTAWLHNSLDPADEAEWWQLLADPELDSVRQDMIQALYDSEDVRHVMEPEAAEALFTRIRQVEQGRLRKMSWARVAAAVAVIIGLIGLGGGWWWLAYQAGDHKQPLIATTPKDLQPGGNKAVLTLAGGRIIVLDSAANGLLAEQGGTQVQKQGSAVTYGGVGHEAPHNRNERTPKADAPILFNTLSTPRGGQYQLTLEDGTKVWLNAASSITYPTAFTGKIREVTITGEAYFEVVHNAAHPFRVQAGGVTLEDLGTAFNVNAYTDEPVMVTTLAQGALSVGSMILSPGQAADRAADGHIRLIRHADVEQALAWKNGAFAFNGADLATVMRQLSRWYDVDVEYKGAIPAGTFSGKIGRGLTLTQVLTGLAATRIHYQLIDQHHMLILP